DRMRIVVSELNAPARLPAESVGRRPLAIQAEDHRIVPDQNVYLQPAFAPHEVVQETAELELPPPLVRAQETRATMKVPARNQDGTMRLARGRDEGLEVRIGVDQERGAFRTLDAPTISARVEQAGRNRVLGHGVTARSEEHTSELQSRENIVCRLLLEKKNGRHYEHHPDAL